MKKTLSEKSTKILILEAAFSFFEQPYYKDFSLSEIAQKVGITKPAIYRHFKSKEQILDAMREHFIDILADLFLGMQASESENAVRAMLSKIICFFANNPQFINYYILQMSAKNGNLFEKNVYFGLLERGVKKEENVFAVMYPFTEARTSITQSIFSGSTILFFIKVLRDYIDRGIFCSDMERFSEKLIDFLYSGVSGLVSEDGAAYLKELSAERRKELNEICSFSPDLLPPQDRIFNAFATVIQNNGLNGVTVEKIAAELNMAKSSLYFYFKDKNQMIRSLILEELQLLNIIVSENISEAKNYSEYIYIAMKTELNFFKYRESVISMCSWLLQTSTENPFDDECEISNIWEKKIGAFLQEKYFGFPMRPEILTFWIGMLPVVLVLLMKKKNLTEHEQEDAFEDFFEYVQFGVNKIERGEGKKDE